MMRRSALLLAAALAIAATAEERLVLPTPDSWTRVDGVESPSLRDRKSTRLNSSHYS